MTGELLGAVVVSDEMAEATGDRAWLRALLDAETALARAEADQGLIPRRAADAIAGVAHADLFDPAVLGRAARLGGNPVIALVPALEELAGPAAAGWVHWGATSQDIMDTAQMLVSARAGDLVDRHLAVLAEGCATLAVDHRHTTMPGRTLLQQALPMTFGLVAAGWLSGAVAARDQLRSARAGLSAQLGGAVGTLASLGDDGPAVLERFADLVGLPAPTLPWHTARQRVSGLAGALGTVAGTAAKISGDVVLLMQTEVGEAAEPTEAGRGGSSTLPHKRNPVAGAAVGSAARQAIALLPVLYGALISEHQRPVGAWQAEWEASSRLLALAGSAVSMTASTVTGLEVRSDAMAANLELTQGLLLAERVSLALAQAVDDGRPVGRPAARAAVQEASQRALASGRPLGAELAEQALVSRLLSTETIATLLDPTGYLGATDTWIDRALASHASTGAW